jgi:hypothetical protein
MRLFSVKFSASSYYFLSVRLDILLNILSSIFLIYIFPLVCVMWSKMVAVSCSEILPSPEIVYVKLWMI